jgi:hypothetical protein
LLCITKKKRITCLVLYEIACVCVYFKNYKKKYLREGYKQPRYNHAITLVVCSYQFFMRMNDQLVIIKERTSQEGAVAQVFSEELFPFLGYPLSLLDDIKSNQIKSHFIISN